MTFFKLSAAVLALALPGFAFAQTATTTTEPAAASMDWADDAGITARMEQSGYTDVKIMRDGSKLTIDAMKDGKPTNLVYDTTSGALSTVDGAGYTNETTDPMAESAGAGGDATTMGQSGGNPETKSSSQSGNSTDTGGSGETSTGGDTAHDN